MKLVTATSPKTDASTLAITSSRLAEVRFSSAADSRRNVEVSETCYGAEATVKDAARTCRQNSENDPEGTSSPRALISLFEIVPAYSVSSSLAAIPTVILGEFWRTYSTSACLGSSLCSKTYFRSASPSQHLVAPNLQLPGNSKAHRTARTAVASSASARRTSLHA